MSEVEFPRDWPQTFTMVGPVTGTPERVLPTAAPPPRLPRGPLVLITIGTHLHWARRDLIAQVAALASRVRSHTFVLTLGQVGASLPSDLPGSRVHIVDHMPYDEVLPACDAVIHHGGAGITYSAIRAGVPALVQPRDYDQFDFAARITASGAGVRIRHPLGHPATAAALTTLLRADRSRLQALTTAIRGYDPVAATAAIVNREIRR